MARVVHEAAAAVAVASASAPKPTYNLNGPRTFETRPPAPRGPFQILLGNMNLQPLSVGLFRFNGLYATEPQLIQAASVMTMVIPLLIFFFAQRFFMQGVVVTGVDK